jgi:acyl-CoA synthetase (AMP-forming)/AMP-acid ligase II
MPLPLLREALKAWPETDFIQVYGLTEVCGVVTRLGPEDHRGDNEDRLVSAGKPINGVEVRIVDPDTLADVETGNQGEIWFRTKQLMKGYHNKPEATAEAVTPDGWFRTGDVGRIDADGYLYVEDRIKDMIITGGENVYSIEVERILAEHPAVVEVAVFGVPDEKWGEAVKAVVALQGEASEADLIGWARQRLAAYKCPKSVEIVEALPRNPTGKILKRICANRIGRDARGPPSDRRGGGKKVPVGACPTRRARSSCAPIPVPMRVGMHADMGPGRRWRPWLAVPTHT